MDIQAHGTNIWPVWVPMVHNNASLNRKPLYDKNGRDYEMYVAILFEIFITAPVSECWIQ